MKHLEIIVMLLLCSIHYSVAVVINALGFSLDSGSIYTRYTNLFNDYAKEKNLDITLHLTLINKYNMTTTLENSNHLIESSLKRKNNKYDIYFYESSYLPLYSSYLLELGNVLPKEHVDMYDKTIMSQISYNKGKMLGIPICLTTSALYSNKRLLEKHHRNVPKTWKEMIETSEYILNEERKENNTEIVLYNGILGDVDHGLVSIVEYIYSCRDSVDSDFPDLTSQTAINAAELIKTMKNKLSIHGEFEHGIDFSFGELADPNILFLKFYILLGKYMAFAEQFHMSNLPE